MTPKRVLLAHADLSAGGGAEAYAKAMIRELRQAGHVVGTLDINGHWPPAGRRRLPFPLAFGTGWLTRRFSLWKYALVCRALPRIAPAYDHVVLSYGEGPALTRPTLRLLHAPRLFSTDPKVLAVLGARTRGLALPLRQIYAWVCTRIARPVLRPDATVTLTNSRWTARKAAEWAGITDAQVLYPEVRNPARPRSVPSRDPYRILALGRIVPGKRLEQAVALTEALRDQGLPARLEVLGRADTAYARRFLKAHRRHPNVTLTPNASPADLVQALARARLGFHGYRQEHFGIAVGEMIAAGVIPLVFDGGGVAELVPDEQLRFRTRAEAITSARRVLEMNVSECQTLRRNLQATPALTQARNFNLCLAQVLADHISPAAQPAKVALSLHDTPLDLTNPLPFPDPDVPRFLRPKRGRIQPKKHL